MEQGVNVATAVDTLQSTLEKSFKALSSEIESSVGAHQQLSALVEIRGRLSDLKFHAVTEQNEKVETTIIKLVEVYHRILEVMKLPECESVACRLDLANAVIAAMILVLQIRIFQGVQVQTAKKSSMLVKEATHQLKSLKEDLMKSSKATDVTLVIDMQLPRLKQLDVLLWTLYSQVTQDLPDGCSMFEEITLAQILDLEGSSSLAISQDREESVMEGLTANSFDSAAEHLFRGALALRGCWKCDMDKVEAFGDLRKDVTLSAFTMRDGLVPLSKQFVSDVSQFFECFPETMEEFEQSLEILIEETDDILKKGRTVQSCTAALHADFDAISQKMEGTVRVLEKQKEEALQEGDQAQFAVEEGIKGRLWAANKWRWLRFIGGQKLQNWVNQNAVREMQDEIDRRTAEVLESKETVKLAAAARDLVSCAIEPSIKGFLASLSEILCFFQVFNDRLKRIRDAGRKYSRQVRDDYKKRSFMKILSTRKNIADSCNHYIGKIALFNQHFELMEGKKFEIFQEKERGERVLLWFKEKDTAQKIDLRTVKAIFEDADSPVAALMAKDQEI